MATPERAVSTAARALPARDPSPKRARPELDVVDRRRTTSRPHRRQANILRGLGVLFIVGALAVTAAAHAFVASDQQRIDTLQSKLTQTLAEQQDLQLARAELESPARVLAIAERELGMISPQSVSYLAPVDPGPSVSQAGAAAARAALSAAETARKPVPAGGDRTRTGTSLAGARSLTIPPPVR